MALPGCTPALFIRTSVPPKRSRTAASSRVTSSTRLTSIATVMTCAAPPVATADTADAAAATRSSPRSAMHKRRLRRANALAAARPMPDAPPVTTATALEDKAGWGKDKLRSCAGGR